MSKWVYAPKIICPYCSCKYISKNETRLLVECQYCNGSGRIAKQKENEIKSVLRSENLETIQKTLALLSPGYWRFRYLLYLEKRSQDV